VFFQPKGNAGGKFATTIANKDGPDVARARLSRNDRREGFYARANIDPAMAET
jgi:hypothetical protein